MRHYSKPTLKSWPRLPYRGRVWGRGEASAQQLTFVDIGLLPVVERSAGEDLRQLLERSVSTAAAALGWQKEISPADGGWLLRAVFWLLAAKILKDKGVPGFVRGSLLDLETVYARLAKHYDRHAPRPVQIDGSHRRDALLGAAATIQRFGHCGAVTTESLAWVYESTLIDRTTRQNLARTAPPRGWWMRSSPSSVRGSGTWT